MDEHPVAAPGDPGVEVFHVLAPDDTPARLCLVRQIHANMRLRQRESRVQSMIVAVVVAASAVALAWLYSAGESREGVSMAAPLLTLHEVLWQGRDVPEGVVVDARRQVRRRAERARRCAQPAATAAWRGACAVSWSLDTTGTSLPSLS